MIDPPTNQKAKFGNLEWLKTFNANLRNKVFFDSTQQNYFLNTLNAFIILLLKWFQSMA